MGLLLYSLPRLPRAYQLNKSGQLHAFLHKNKLMSIMKKDEIEKLMHNCFVLMMTQNMLNSNGLLFKVLKSITFCLENTCHLSKADVAYALQCFWKEYNMGCRPPMTQDQINNKIIPAVYSYPDVDISLGSKIIDIALDHI